MTEKNALIAWLYAMLKDDVKLLRSDGFKKLESFRDRFEPSCRDLSLNLVEFGALLWMVRH